MTLNFEENHLLYYNYNPIKCSVITYSKYKKKHINTIQKPHDIDVSNMIATWNSIVFLQ